MQYSDKDMGKFEKLMDKLGNQKSDNAWSYDDLVYLLGKNEFKLFGGKGSHQVFQNDKTERTVVLAKHGNKIKSGYVRSVRKAIKDED